MKFMSIRAELTVIAPMIISRLGPYLSASQPTIGPSNPPSSLPIEEGIDVAARLMPNSEAIGKNNAEIPYE